MKTLKNGSWVGAWAARSVPATAGTAYVEGRPRRGGLSSRVEGTRAPWGASEHADRLPDAAPRRARGRPESARETRVRGLSPSRQVQVLSLGRW